MQQVSKPKGRGLVEFARGKSDSNAHYNAASEKPYPIDSVKRPATPKADIYQPSRQEIAEFARLPVPGAAPRIISSPRANTPLRNIHRSESPHQPGYGSPKRHLLERQSRTRTTYHDIFSGSQLGENFMNSGLTTPANDPEVLEVVQRTEIKAEERPEQSQFNSIASRNPPQLEAENHQFSVAVDGRLSVVPGTYRHNPSHMNDGFYNHKSHSSSNHVRYQPKPAKHPIPAYPLPAPPLQAQARLPMRGVRVSRAQPLLTNALPIQVDEQPPRGKFTAVEEEGGGGEDEGGEAKWEDQALEKVNESILVHGSDDDSGALGNFGENMALPRAKKHHGPHTKAARDGNHRPSKVARNSQQKDKKRRRQSLDYDDKVLSSMTYQDLQEEPFDVVPQLAGMLNGHDSAASKLVTRLEQFQQQGEREQLQFFSHMSIEEWENAGDWFVEQFADIMGRLRQARRNKRQMVAAFEKEASEREEAIRSRTDAIDKKLFKMKQDGQRVVGDKHL
ncbi:hypothetical protein E4U42_005338 [Claviceps africana]|uniref:Extracellular mutant protein 11 C-terminal domain-containing protein n=1 Tax=Claviceps africana TaxID=83212 RepID=A0A8K0J3X0_9HYPO|nr:hypothetical protein E4U42_005338 [Claviceps africana]